MAGSPAVKPPVVRDYESARIPISTLHVEAIAAPLASLPGHVPGRPVGGASRQKRSAAAVAALMKVAVAGGRTATWCVRQGNLKHDAGIMRPGGAAEPRRVFFMPEAASAWAVVPAENARPAAGGARKRRC